LVYSSAITMMHGPINIRFTAGNICTRQYLKLRREHITCSTNECQIVFLLEVLTAGLYSSHSNIITRAPAVHSRQPTPY